MKLLRLMHFVSGSVLFSAGLNFSIAATPVPSAGGPLPSGVHSDELSWQHFIAAVTPAGPAQVVFETWASDPDVYNFNPRWPTPEQAKTKQLRTSLLLLSQAPHPISMATIDGECGQVGNAHAGNFPVAGVPAPQPIVLAPPQPCFAEEVRRNRASFDYLVDNGLNTKPGLAKAHLKAKKSSWRVNLPVDSVEVKADWIPVDTLADWLASNYVKTSVAQIKKQYYTTVSAGVTYGLVSFHISSKEIPNWVWASFEHEGNPGRCDTMGCLDAFGARQAQVTPAAFPSKNSQYGSCTKSPALEKMFKAARLDQVWNNYCLKSSQIDYVAKDGAPLMLGDSFTERVAANVPIDKSSCMSCHAAAAVNADGSAFTELLRTSPMGKVSLPMDAMAVDFIWGILGAPPPIKQ